MVRERRKKERGGNQQIVEKGKGKGGEWMNLFLRCFHVFAGEGEREKKKKKEKRSGTAQGGGKGAGFLVV